MYNRLGHWIVCGCVRCQHPWDHDLCSPQHPGTTEHGLLGGLSPATPAWGWAQHGACQCLGLCHMVLCAGMPEGASWWSLRGSLLKSRQSFFRISSASRTHCWWRLLSLASCSAGQCPPICEQLMQGRGGGIKLRTEENKEGRRKKARQEGEGKMKGRQARKAGSEEGRQVVRKAVQAGRKEGRKEVLRKVVREKRRW